MKKVAAIFLCFFALICSGQNTFDLTSQDKFLWAIKSDLGEDAFISGALDQGGYIYIYGHIDYGFTEHPFLCKLDASGSIQWQKKISSVDNGLPTSLQFISDKFVMVGTAGSPGDRISFIAQFDEQGTILNYNELDLGRKSYLRDFIFLNDTTYLLTGVSYIGINGESPFFEGNNDLFLVEIDTSLAIRNVKLIDYQEKELGNSAVKTRDGGLALCGYMGDSGSDGFVIKFNAAAELEWYKKYSASSEIILRDIIESDNSQIHVVGSIDQGDKNTIHLKLNAQGGVISSSIIELSSGDDFGSRIALRGDTVDIFGLAEYNGVINFGIIQLLDDELVVGKILNAVDTDLSMFSFQPLEEVNGHYLFGFNQRNLTPGKGGLLLLDGNQSYESLEYSGVEASLSSFEAISVSNVVYKEYDTSLIVTSPSYVVNSPEMIVEVNGDSCLFEGGRDSLLYCDTAFLLQAPIGATSYRWEGFSSTLSTLEVSSSGTFTCTLTARGCQDSIIYEFDVFDTCAVQIWPGDCDNDGIANAWDIIPIGITYGSGPGPVRSYDDNTLWEAQDADSWGVLKVFGNDGAHIDANGDGVIDTADVHVIRKNYGQTHNRSLSNNRGIAAGEPLFFMEMLSDTFAQGDTLRARINIGDANFYGLAFRVAYNPEVLVDSTIKVEFDSSILGSHNIDFVTLDHVDSTLGYIEIGMTKIGGVDHSGFGELGKIVAVIEENIGGGRDFDSVSVATLSVENVNAYREISSEVLLDAVDTSVSSAIIVKGWTGQAEVKKSFGCSVFPNPSQGILNVAFQETKAKNIWIWDYSGKKVYSSVLLDRVNRIDISFLQRGILFVQIEGYPVKKIFLD